MQKYADKYLVVDPWRIIEQNFDPERNNVSESIFSLGNEYMGIRGYFEEGYSGGSFLGSYFNGVYEIGEDAAALHYKGIVKQTHFMINALDWLYTRISLEGETLDLAASKIKDYKRILDLKTGVLSRSFTWETSKGQLLNICFERFVSMTSPKHGCQRITFKALNFDGQVEVSMGLDFNTIHRSTGKNYWNCPKVHGDEAAISIMGKTSITEQKIYSAAVVTSTQALDKAVVEREKYIGYEFRVKAVQGTEVNVDKLVLNHVVKDKSIDESDLWAEGEKLAEELLTGSYDEEKKKHASYWQRVWDTSDITIEGDLENQQGIRYCIFQMHQTYHGEDPTLNIGAKGLTGEAYNGHTFWDTETYCLPFYIFNNPKAARNLLEYRYNTLDQALERAKQLDCEGACYPIATLNGREACTLWQHASLQFQPSTAVAYGIFHYVKVTGDKEFLYEKGCETLIQICRFLATRGDWGSRTGEFGYFGVMGPDEFQMMVNNNCYTNYMAKKTFEYAIDVIKEMKENASEKLQALFTKLDFSDSEVDNWTKMVNRMRIPLDKATGIYEQHDGYFDLPHVDINKIPVEDFPLYNHWSYDRIYRNDMIKQPDVLMFMFLYSEDFSLESKRVNYEFYEPRCIHESSLSPSIHSIFAAELGKHREAFEFFKFATRMDLDNYNRNTNEGLHTTSIAASWVNIVYGFGGMRSDGNYIKMNPSIPKEWQSYSFKILYKGSVVSVSVNKEAVKVKVNSGQKVSLNIYGSNYEIDEDGIILPLPERQKG
ncbi:glycoside hydrolase family 65 protein [Clostridium thermarum]|uniref:glycoside hydrolase family 65 protein n=1 Tax=Clostridium thermarum TaxID=1716543 RepID=UPI00111DE7C6|nr:glycosyl hydrolase family 65 protein [Clostridium thermarum]